MEPDYQKILQGKIDYYGETKAAYQFAAEEYARQYHEWMKSRQAAVKDFVCVCGSKYAINVAHKWFCENCSKEVEMKQTDH
jgi:hypothetical protein